MSVIKVENATSKKEMSLRQKMLYIKAEKIKIENVSH